tara:strand:+ start:2815 stop:4788 length:1974 start_codon:yes stop_codon:yes gene_type:complete
MGSVHNNKSNYSADAIEVLEGLEPVRMRPAMYIGGSDERAMHHLAAELLDNAMDEAVAGHASWIEFKLKENGTLMVQDNGRGIPIDAHPKFKNKTALEVVMTTLHSGGKFDNKVYNTSGGLHGVGLSVVNALSDTLTVEVTRKNIRWKQKYSRGKPTSKLEQVGPAKITSGTAVTFHPDTDIFGKNSKFQPKDLYAMAKAKAYLFKGVRIRWKCESKTLDENSGIPKAELLHFPSGLTQYLEHRIANRNEVIKKAFHGEGKFNGKAGKIEWAVSWTSDGDASLLSYCNTIHTPEGGTHEAGLRNALVKGLRAYAELIGSKRASIITGEDVMGCLWGVLSAFIPNPEFQGQTKEKLTTRNLTRNIESIIKDNFDHFLTDDPKSATILLDTVLGRAEDRLNRKKAKETSRKSATRTLRLPGKLSDCSNKTAEGTELFLVEGDSAGGSAKQARDRATQAVLPLRGKILNVASASAEKIHSNQELNDLMLALGCGIRSTFDLKKLRYEKIIIMTDADVDGAHIASLIMTFFWKEMPELITNGHLYLALPPLYRLVQGSRTEYAMNDQEKDQLLRTVFSQKEKIEISRFKGLGEMPSSQLKETTMSSDKRILLKIIVPDPILNTEDFKAMDTLIDDLMGRRADRRLAFIQKNAHQSSNALDL